MDFKPTNKMYATYCLVLLLLVMSVISVVVKKDGEKSTKYYNPPGYGKKRLTNVTYQNISTKQYLYKTTESFKGNAAAAEPSSHWTYKHGPHQEKKRSASEDSVLKEPTYTNENSNPYTPKTGIPISHNVSNDIYNGRWLTKSNIKSLGNMTSVIKDSSKSDSVTRELVHDRNESKTQNDVIDKTLAASRDMFKTFPMAYDNNRHEECVSFLKDISGCASDFKVKPGHPCQEMHECSCWTDKQNRLTVDCSKRNLTEIPEFPNKTAVILLAGNKIKKIGSGKFKHLKQLLCLDISENEIEHLNSEGFSGLQNVCTLKLNGNNIRYTQFSIPDNTFQYLDSLVYLDLQQNLPNFMNESYPSVALSSLKELRVLHIDGIGNSSFGEEFKFLKQLNSLSCTGKFRNGRCLLEAIRKDMFKNLPYLNSLKLDNCSLQRVENGSFGELPSLDSLDLSYNENLRFQSLANITFALRGKKMKNINLSKINPTFGGCERVEKRDLQYMATMTIENIFLDSNRLAYMPEETVDYLPNLTGKISLRDNILLLGKYVQKALFQNKFKDLKEAIFSDQMINHDLIELVRNDTRSTEHVQHNLVDTTEENRSDDLIKRRKREEPVRILGNCENCDQLKDVPTFDFPRNLQFLNMSNMKMRFSFKKICICEPNSFSRIDLHMNVLYRFVGTIYGLTHLTFLDVSNNLCENIGTNTFHEMPGLRLLNLSKNFLGISFSEDGNGDIFREQRKLLCLDISENRITRLPKLFFKGLLNVAYIILRNNLMTVFDLDLSSMNNLSYIDLGNNLLMHIDHDVLLKFDLFASTTNFTINLAQNRLVCNCKNRDFVKWVSTSQVIFRNWRSYTCTDENEKTRNLTMATSLYNDLVKLCRNYTLIICLTVAAVLLSVIVVTTGIVYRYRWNLRYFYYSAKMKMQGFLPVQGDDDDDFDHDVFISYAEENRTFVRELIIPELEEKRHLRLLIHDRDFRAGEFVQDNIVRAICSSKKTLIVMSRAFLQSAWCRFEMNMARMETINTGRSILVIILLEEVSVAGLHLEIVDAVRQQTYLEWPHDAIHREQFWERLYSSLK